MKDVPDLLPIPSVPQSTEFALLVEKLLLLVSGVSMSEIPSLGWTKTHRSATAGQAMLSERRLNPGRVSDKS
jgi:hypothetical protein